MKLTYRGVSYDHIPNPMPKMGEPSDTGFYRGARVTFRSVAEVPAQPVANLTWRGAAYRTGTPVVASAEPVVVAEPQLITEPPVMAEPVMAAQTEAVAPATNIPELARNLFIRRHQRSRKREQGMMVRLAAEVGLPVDEAAHYESHVQGKLPHNFAAYERSSTAMS